MHNNDSENLKMKKLIGKDIYPSKNDSGKGGILYLLFSAPKVNMVL